MKKKRNSIGSISTLFSSKINFYFSTKWNKLEKLKIITYKQYNSFIPFFYNLTFK